MAVVIGALRVDMMNSGVSLIKHIMHVQKKLIYSRLSLSRIPRDSLKHFEISVPRHIRVESEENNKLNNHI